ncbi:MAG TPA: DTW domain-containing protein [Marinagarivorans sp.]
MNEPLAPINMNAFRRLYKQRMAAASKPFLARGITVERCDQCLLARRCCLCAFLAPLPNGLELDIILLMHRDEILKPTNTGRLLAEAFPEQCFVFEWSRLEPDPALLAMIQDPARQCAIVYPAKQARATINIEAFDELPVRNDCSEQLVCNGLIAQHFQPRRATLILLDGTWRQAARMFNHSRWLSHLPSLALPDARQATYAVRKASEDSRLSTAEAAVALLAYCGQQAAANHLWHVFSVFNQHYQATRMCINIEPSSSHQYLQRMPKAAINRRGEGGQRG